MNKKNLLLYPSILIISSLIFLISCEKDDIDDNDDISQIESSTVTDNEGNTYKTVKIGTQWWMAENLKTTKYNNGDLIGTTNPASLDISGENAPKYQWAYNGNDSNVAVYGRLYTGYTLIDTRGICPSSWHVPTDAEWTTLTDYLGGESIAGGKLKEVGTTHWPYPNTGATNETEFTAIPSGWRRYSGSFYYINQNGYWWCTTEKCPSNTLGRGLFYDKEYIYKFFGFIMSDGVAVRCVKD